MMKYYKFIENGYITSVMKTQFSYDNGISISKDEYDHIQSIIKKRPDLKDGCGRRLNEKTMEWEFYDLPPDEEVSEPDPDEALRTVLNVLTDSQKSKLSKNESVKTLFDQYEVKR